MVVILMRHGVRDPGVDAPLSTYDKDDLEQSSPELWETIRALKETSSLKKILCSPYLRTRQTAELLQYGILKSTGRYVPIVIDCRLGEYQPKKWSWKVPPAGFDQETITLYQGRVPLYRESAEMFTLRVYGFYQSLGGGEDVIVVSHKGVLGLLGLFRAKTIELEMGHYAYLSGELTKSLTELDLAVSRLD